MNRFEIIFSVYQKGKRKHLIKAENLEAATRRLEAAYPDREVTIIKHKEMETSA